VARRTGSGEGGLGGRWGSVLVGAGMALAGEEHDEDDEPDERDEPDQDPPPAPAGVVQPASE
jgi:hypothetical protein